LRRRGEGLLEDWAMREAPPLPSPKVRASPSTLPKEGEGMMCRHQCPLGESGQRPGEGCHAAGRGVHCRFGRPSPTATRPILPHGGRAAFIVLPDNRLSMPETRVEICFRPDRAEGDSRGPMASSYHTSWDLEPHSMPEQKNVQQGMSNFETDACFEGTTDFQSVDQGRHRQTGSPSYEHHSIQYV
jgi:hypothetical protein